jgi:dTDP-4-dehydrorhamnose reductase
MLGAAIHSTAARRGFEVSPFSRALAWETPERLVEQMSGYEWFIHCAANTNVEQCEIDPTACYRDNLLLTEILARAARRASTRLLLVSSTGVYGAAKSEPYREYDAVEPTTHHHRSKYLAEQAVLAQHVDNLVVRTGWLFGGDRANPKNFVVRRLEEASMALANGGVLRSNTEQCGVPSYVGDVAERMLTLAEAGHAGAFNCVNSGRASRFEYVKEIVHVAGLPVEVHPIAADAFGRKARVSPNEMAENWKMQQLGFAPLPDWRSSLESYLSSLSVRVA